jgi:hypothetical protein
MNKVAKVLHGPAPYNDPLVSTTAATALMYTPGSISPPSPLSMISNTCTNSMNKPAEVLHGPAHDNASQESDVALIEYASDASYFSLEHSPAFSLVDSAAFNQQAILATDNESAGVATFTPSVPLGSASIHDNTSTAAASIAIVPFPRVSASSETTVPVLLVISTAKLNTPCSATFVSDKENHAAPVSLVSLAAESGPLSLKRTFVESTVHIPMDIDSPPNCAVKKITLDAEGSKFLKGETKRLNKDGTCVFTIHTCNGDFPDSLLEEYHWKSDLKRGSTVILGKEEISSKKIKLSDSVFSSSFSDTMSSDVTQKGYVGDSKSIIGAAKFKVMPLSCVQGAPLPQSNDPTNAERDDQCERKALKEYPENSGNRRSSKRVKLKQNTNIVKSDESILEPFDSFKIKDKGVHKKPHTRKSSKNLGKIFEAILISSKKPLSILASIHVRLYKIFY